MKTGEKSQKQKYAERKQRTIANRRKKIVEKQAELAAQLAELQKTCEHPGRTALSRGYLEITSHCPDCGRIWTEYA